MIDSEPWLTVLGIFLSHFFNSYWSEVYTKIKENSKSTWRVQNGFLPHHERLGPSCYKGGVAHMVECSLRIWEAHGSILCGLHHIWSEVSGLALWSFLKILAAEFIYWVILMLLNSLEIWSVQSINSRFLVFFFHIPLIHTSFKVYTFLTSSLTFGALIL